jgi:hypothetical protein
MESLTLSGGCLCGAVRYAVSGPLGAAEYCHCNMCRKAHGSAFSANVLVSATDFSAQSGQDLICKYASSPNRLKCFCKRCGSQLFIRRTNKPEHPAIALGSLDKAPRTRPVRHVFVASKAPWHDITDTLPQYAIYPCADA